MLGLSIAFLLTIAGSSAATAQPVDPRRDARIYFDAERWLEQTEANATCGGAYHSQALHRVVDLRGELLSMRRFANREGEVTRLRQLHPEEEPGLCVSDAGTEPALREARRHIKMLRQRMRRSRWRDPDMTPRQ